MKSLGLIHHLGLGDFIDCNGLVRYILKHSEYKKIYLISKRNYFKMVDYMYKDEPLIEILPIENPDPPSASEELHSASKILEGKIDDMLIIGFANFDWNAVKEKNKNCWQVFYDQMQVPYDVRKNYYKMERDEKEELRVLNKLNPSGEPFAFVHDDKERGFELNTEHVNSNLKIIRNDLTENIFHFTKIIEGAKEIHCMESSYKSLVDVLEPKGKLYFHDFRGHPLGDEGERRWEIINYEQRLKHYSQS